MDQFKDDLKEFQESEKNHKNSKTSTLIKPEDPGRLDLRSKFEWQSVGRVRIDLKKLLAPSRWRSIQEDPLVKKYKNSQMWWDIHLLHRKRLVMF